MSSEFNIILKDSSGYVGIIVCNTHYYPVDYLDDLNSELKYHKVKGMLVVDLLLVNGSNSNRYAVCSFDGEHIDMASMKKVEKVPADYQRAVANYFYENYYLIENSILSRASKFRFKKRLAA